MKGRAGFTLLELLVSITILAMIGGIIYVSFASVTDTQAVAREYNDQLRFRQFLWNNLRDNLSAIYADAACADPSYLLLGEPGEGAHGPAHSLRFVAALPMPGTRSLPGVIKTVTYAVVDGDGMDSFSVDDGAAGAGPMLQVVEEPLVLDPLDFETGARPDVEPVIRDVPIASLAFSYFDGEEWVDAWDSNVEGRMPWAIRVEARFAELGGGRALARTEAPDLEMIVPVMIGLGTVDEFLDLNHARNVEYAEDPQV